MIIPCLLFISLSLPVSGITPFVRRYEPLTYRTLDSDRQSRSTEAREEVRLTFEAYNRTFKLILRPLNASSSSVFAENATIEFGRESEKIDSMKSSMYAGVVEGDLGSYASGYIHDGVFEGVFELSNGTRLGVESSHRHDPSAPFHSFVYKVEDLDMSKQSHDRKRSANVSEEEEEAGENIDFLFPNQRDERDWLHEPIPFPQKSRHPAKKDASSGLWTYRACKMSIQVDYLLFKDVLKKDAKNKPARARRFILDLINHEMREMNKVYRAHDFRGVRGLSFQVANVKIFESLHEDDYHFSSELNATKLLSSAAQLDYGQHCLAYLMTYREFERDILGMAFVGTACSPYYKNSKVEKSSNTGVVTYLNKGHPVLRSTSYLTLTHEVGHNLGAVHDEKGSCEGDEQKGRYIMWGSSTSADEPNSRIFSPCSIKAISAFLHSIMRIDPGRPMLGKGNCFVDADTPICGNGIVEVGEVCDCGYTEQQCADAKDQCCYPAEAGEERGCTLKRGSCSPSQGTCCTDNCEIKNETICLETSDCASSSSCDGLSPVCPPPTPLREAQPCHDASAVCSNGRCVGSLCRMVGLRDCNVTTQTCMLHCEKDGECISTAHLKEFDHERFTQTRRPGQGGLMRRPGSICLDGQGICTRFDTCAEIRVIGPLVRTTVKIIEAIKSAYKLFNEKYWLLVLAILVMVAFFVLFIKLCSYSTPGVNPKRRNRVKSKSTEDSVDVEMNEENGEVDEESLEGEEWTTRSEQSQ